MSQRSRRGLATWLTTSRTPLFVLDERRVVLVFNQGCEELTQWPAAEVIGKTCLYQTDPNPDRVSSLTGALCPAPQPAEQTEFFVQRTVFQRPDGTLLEREIHFFPLLASDGHSKQHLLGLIVPCGETVPSRVNPHLEIGRHTAALHKRYGVERLVAQSPEMQRVAAQVELARSHRATVHFCGERGTGKEHLARLIHYGSEERSQRFVPLRCASSSHFELKSALERLTEPNINAGVGTIYLDEVTALPGDLQQLILSRGEQVDCRWYSSSRNGLDQLSEEEFLPQLRARLTSQTIAVPALRDRLEDLPLLAQQLLEEWNSKQARQHAEITLTVIRLFQQYDWPGNVDELSQVIAQACERGQNSEIEPDDLPFEFIASLDSRTIRPAPIFRSLDEQLAEFERNLIVQVLEESRGNKSLAAERLGMPRAKLYRRLAQYGLDQDHEETGGDEIECG